MENGVDTQNFHQRKEALAMKSKNLKVELDQQLGVFKGEAADFAKKALIAGGSLYITYKVGKGLYKRRKRKKLEKSLSQGVSSTSGNSVKKLLQRQAGILLMAYLKKRLSSAFTKK